MRTTKTCLPSFEYLSLGRGCRDRSQLDVKRKREDDILSQQNISSYSKKIKNSEVRQTVICSLTFQRLFMKDSGNAKMQRQSSLWKRAQACGHRCLFTSLVYLQLARGQWENEQKAIAVLTAFQMTLPQSGGRRWFLFIELTQKSVQKIFWQGLAGTGSRDNSGQGCFNEIQSKHHKESHRHSEGEMLAF